MIRVLVIKPSSLGDIIHGLQVIQSLRNQLGNDAHVTWVARDCFADFVDACDTVDKTLVFERKGGLFAFISLIKQIRKNPFDYVLDLQGLARSGLLTFFAKGKRKLVRSDAREFARFASTERVLLPTQQPAHAVDILLGFLQKLDLKPELSASLSFSKLDLPKPHQPDLEIKNPILIFPDSRRAEKEWPYFSELTRLLLENCPNQHIIWLGQKKIPADPNWPKPHFLNWIGKTDLLDIIPLINQSALVICNDSGPMHLAAAMGKTVLTLFGPTSPKQYGPYPLNNPNHHILTAENGNLARLGPDTVFEKVAEIIKCCP
ncbi:MAG: hypothetical protein COZ46_02025 [Verrucomicrobia bacterium CG_4_10_14_3_um_filter_43_23]|nr:MAG: hypothetical protein AUJ82_07125 [Verrucomicrobia bacterium CG1_02_43_26]PIX58788.1 MAG: hypothetical protein COZ46_02025 [Verrucomicrobia bacterium CG_4_10_14_3_um_filter_43_23]